MPLAILGVQISHHLIVNFGIGESPSSIETLIIESLDCILFIPKSISLVLKLLCDVSAGKRTFHNVAL